jgi:hypothetical protein
VQMDRVYGETDEDRFWHYVTRGHRCWEWGGYRNEKGYGVINLRGRRMLAHRFAWQLQASLPSRLSVLHHCDNPACVKFKHLFLGTRADNNADMRQKGRDANPPRLTGARNHQTHVSEEDVRNIRVSLESGPVLAERYGITRTQIWMIRHRRSWAHIQ